MEAGRLDIPKCGLQQKSCDNTSKGSPLCSRSLANLATGCQCSRQIGNWLQRGQPNSDQPLKAHLCEWFWFILEPGLDATIYRAEQSLRPAAVNRNVWGGNRTDAGARGRPDKAQTRDLPCSACYNAQLAWTAFDRSNYRGLGCGVFRESTASRERRDD